MFRTSASISLVLMALALAACGSDPDQPPGIGVSRQAIQSVYEGPDIAFTFESAPLADGTPRVVGESPDGLAFLELIGPEHDITKSTIMVGMPSDAPGVIVMNAAYMLGLLKHAVPAWTGAADWLADNLAAAAEKGEARTAHGNVDVSLTSHSELGMVLLTVEARVGEEHPITPSGDEDRALSDTTRRVDDEIARLVANNRRLNRDREAALARALDEHEAEIARLRGEYEAEIALLHDEHNDWRARESRKYQSEIDGLKREIERLRDIAIADSVTAAREEWVETEQLAASVIAAADSFDGRVDAAMAKVDAAAFASAQPKLDALESRMADLGALQQDIDETVDAIYELCMGEKCATVINIEAWTNTPATALNAKRAAFSPNGTPSLTVGDVTLEHRVGIYAVELEQLDVSPFGRPLSRLPFESDRIVGAYRIRIFVGTGSTEPVPSRTGLAAMMSFSNSGRYPVVYLDRSREWRHGWWYEAAFHEGEGYTIALVRSE